MPPLSDRDRTGIGAAAGAGLATATGFTGRARSYGKQGRQMSRDSKSMFWPAQGESMGRKALELKKIGRRNAGVVGAASGLGAAAAFAAKRRRPSSEPFPQPGPVAKMSETQLSHRKKVSAGATVATSTLGLGALGALGAGALLKKPKLSRAAGVGSITAGGLGGLAGFNNASIQRAEAKRNLRPVAKAFDSERSRHKRAQAVGNAGVYGGGAAAAGAGGTAAGLLVGEKVSERMQARAGRRLNSHTTITTPGGIPFRNYDLPRGSDAHKAQQAIYDKWSDRGFNLNSLRRAKGKKIAAVGALGLAGVVAGDRIKSYDRKSGASYKARYSGSE